jgi:hypothetical protein
MFIYIKNKIEDKLISYLKTQKLKYFQIFEFKV